MTTQSVTSHAVEALPQGRSDALLGRRDERRRQVAALDAGGELDPGPTAAASTRSRAGQVRVAALPDRSLDDPVPATRSMHNVEVPREPGAHAVALLEQGGDHLLLHLAVQAERGLAARPRRCAGRSAGPPRPARPVRRTRRRAWLGSSGSTSAWTVAGGNRWVRRRGGRPRVSPIRARGPRSATIWPAVAVRLIAMPPGSLTPTSVTGTGRPVAAIRSRSRTRDLARPQPEPGAAAPLVAVDREHGAGHGAAAFAGPGQHVVHEVAKQRASRPR